MNASILKAGIMAALVCCAGKTETTGAEMPNEVSAKTFFSSDEMVWYGLDFSRAKLLGDVSHFGSDQIPAVEIRDRFFTAWNALILSEPRNFPLEAAFRKPLITNELSVVQERNASIDPDEVYSFNERRLSREDMDRIIGEYPAVQGADVLGMVFIVEHFSKMSEEAALHVTVFDPARRKILFSERVTGSPRGFGLRNYWAGAIKAILRDIDRTHYTKWRRTYAP